MDVLNTIGARECRADTSMAGRPGRALADRAVDTLRATMPRVHSEADLDKIAAAIRKWGWTMPVLVDEEGVLIAGHARVGAAAKLGLEIDPGDRCARLERGGEARLSPGRQSTGGAGELGSRSAPQRAARAQVQPVSTSI